MLQQLSGVMLSRGLSRVSNIGLQNARSAFKGTLLSAQCLINECEFKDRYAEAANNVGVCAKGWGSLPTNIQGRGIHAGVAGANTGMPFGSMELLSAWTADFKVPSIKRSLSFGKPLQDGMAPKVLEEAHKAVEENADPTFLSPEEVKEFGLKRRPPGQYLHQERAIGPARLLHKDFWPLYPLLVALALALGLAVWTMARTLAKHPDVHVRKTHREHVCEIEEPERVLQEAVEWSVSNALRKLARSSSAPIAWVKEKFHQPPHLPGDQIPATGGSGPHRPLGGGY